MKHLCKQLAALALVLAIIASFAVLPAQATELKTGIGIINASCLRLRAKPGTDEEIIGKAYYGDSVVIIREVGDWYLVNCNLEIGYMYKDYIQVKERENVKLGYASFDFVTNIRKGPSTDADIVDQAPKSDTCFIIGFNCGWYKVSYEGQIGYVRSDLLTLLEKPYSNYGSLGNTYHEDEGKTSSAAKTGTTSASKPEETTEKKAASSTANTENTSSSTKSEKTETAADTTTEKKSESSSESKSGKTDSAAKSGSLGDQMVAYAMQYLGYRYVYGGATPSDGFDCSGFTSYVAKHFGFKIGRSAAAQLNDGTYVSRSNLKPGDIVLFERTYTTTAKATHAGMYIGNDKFIHAANSRTGVVIGDLNSDYYASRFVCGRRLG